MPLFDETPVRAILLDIEGTTTPVDFVSTTLFPYASGKLETFLHENYRNSEIRALLEDFRAQQQRDERGGLKPPPWHDGSEQEQVRSSAAYGQWLIARDSKCTPLKTLQGKIWQQGYASGELRGEVYPDVPPAFERWKRQGKTVFIYSSGSVLAQMLLFGSVRAGDLTPYIASFFDTRRHSFCFYRMPEKRLRRREPQECRRCCAAGKTLRARRKARCMRFIVSMIFFRNDGFGCTTSGGARPTLPAICSLPFSAHTCAAPQNEQP